MIDIFEKLRKAPNKYCFKPFDEVVVWDEENDVWTVSLFSHCECSSDGCRWICADGCWHKKCLPYNEETAKLIGTTDDFITIEEVMEAIQPSKKLDLRFLYDMDESLIDG